MKQFVIYLSSQSYGYPYEDYGYWTGEKYTVNGEKFPMCESEITNKTKKYKSKKRAETTAGKLFQEMGSVGSYKVEEFTA